MHMILDLKRFENTWERLAASFQLSQYAAKQHTLMREKPAEALPPVSCRLSHWACDLTALCL